MYDVRWMGAVVFWTLAITLMIFPSVFVLVSPVHFDEGNTWHSKLAFYSTILNVSATFFIPIIVFVLYNIFDYIGRICVAFVKWVSQYSFA